MEKDIDIVSLIKSLLGYLRNNWKLLAILIVLGVVGFFFFIKKKNSEYVNYAEIHCKQYMNIEAMNMLNSLNQVAKRTNDADLAKEMDISTQACESILWINPQVSNNSENSLSISVGISDNQYWEEIGKGICNYLNNSPYFKEQYESNLQKSEEMVQFIIEKQKEVDSVIVNNGYLNQDLGDLLEAKVNLQEKLIGYKMLLKQKSPPFVYSQPFWIGSLNQEPEKRLQYLLGFLGFAFILWLGLVIINEHIIKKL